MSSPSKHRPAAGPERGPVRILRAQRRPACGIGARFAGVYDVRRASVSSRAQPLLGRRCWPAAHSRCRAGLRRRGCSCAPRCARRARAADCVQVRCSTKAWRSMFDICSSLIACCSWRRHDQGLALAQFEPLAQRHGALSLLARSQAEVGAEIIAPHVGVRDDLVGRALRSGPGPHG